MASKLSRIENIDKCTKQVVFGFVRDGSKDCPKLITYTILAYFYTNNDEFDSEPKGNKLLLLKNVCVFGKHIWKFRIDKQETEDFDIGVCKLSTYISSLSTSIDISQYLQMRHGINGYSSRFGPSWFAKNPTKQNDIITMILDFNTLTFITTYYDQKSSFQREQKHNIDDTKYRAAIQFDENNSKLTLISYQHEIQTK